jgi:hypothetical protein
MFVPQDADSSAFIWGLLLRKKPTAFVVMMLALTLLVSATSQAQSVQVPLSSDRWTYSSKNLPAQKQGPEHKGEMMEYGGRQSFGLSNGFAYARDVNFQNGALDVDIAADTRGFLGIAFHVQSEDDYELFFFRPDDSGSTYAIQYTPGLLGGNVWQLFTGPGYTAVADIPREKWIHVRVVVAGLIAKLFLNNAAEPALVISDLRLGHSKGSIGFWGREGGGYFSNLSVTPDNANYPLDVKRNFLTGALTNWELSEMFNTAEKDRTIYPEVHGLKWEKVEAENPGMVVINRYRRGTNADAPTRETFLHGPMPGARFVFARTTIHSDRDEIRKMNFGYSDEIVVYLNSSPIYAGNNTIGFRQPEFLGLMDVSDDAVYLPLKRGDNELMLAVTEYCCGWGFIAKLAP